MTELYRAILSIINTSISNLMDQLRTQIRNHTIIVQESDYGTLGFWNFMLEIVLNFYTIFCKLTGVGLICVLAIIFYPCVALLNITRRVFSGALSVPTQETESSLNNEKTTKNS